MRELYQSGVVRAGHVRKPRSELIVILSDQRVRQQGNMVAKHHYVTHLVAQIKPAGSVGQEEVGYAQQFHHPYREGNLLHCPSFVVMEASLHCNYRLAAQGSANQPGFVANGSADREVGDFAVRNGHGIFYAVGK